MLTKVGKAHINYFRVFSIIRSRCEVIFSQDVAKEGRYLSGIHYVPLRDAVSSRASFVNTYGETQTPIMSRGDAK